MTYRNKSEFMNGLREALGRNDVRDARDILIDFEQHFDDGAAAGETEEEVCRKLGDVDEIVKQYISGDDIPVQKEAPASGAAHAQEASGFDSQMYNGGAPAYTAQAPGYTYNAQQQSKPFSPQGGDVVLVLLLDILIYSWAIPTLFGLIMGLMGITIGFMGAGAGIFFGGVAAFFGDISGFISTGFAPASLVFLGLMFMAFGGMLIIASIGAVKGFINIIIAIINHHGRVFAGHNIATRIGGKKEAAAV